MMQMLRALFDMMASHALMAQWHAEQLQQKREEAARLAAACAELQGRCRDSGAESSGEAAASSSLAEAPPQPSGKADRCYTLGSLWPSLAPCRAGYGNSVLYAVWGRCNHEGQGIRVQSSEHKLLKKVERPQSSASHASAPHGMTTSHYPKLPCKTQA